MKVVDVVVCPVPEKTVFACARAITFVMDVCTVLYG